MRAILFLVLCIIIPAYTETSSRQGDWPSDITVQDWQAKGFKYRRNVKLENKRGGNLNTSDLVYIEIDPNYMLGDKVKKDMSDLLLYYKGREVPYSLTKKSVRYRLYFELRKSLKRNESDNKYFLYYGNPKATRKSLNKKPFDGKIDFSDKEDLKYFIIGKKIDCEIKEGNLVINKAPKGSSIKFKKPVDLKDSSLTVDIIFASRPAMGVISMQVGVGVGYLKDVKLTDKIRKMVKELMKKLDDDDPTVRQDATDKLVETGPSIRNILEAELLKAKSPEVQWRLEFILDDINKRYNKTKVEVRMACYNNYIYSLLYMDGKKITPQYIYQRGLRNEMKLQFVGSKVIYNFANRTVEQSFSDDINQVILTFYADVEDVKIRSITISKESDPVKRLTTQIDVEESK